MRFPLPAKTDKFINIIVLYLLKLTFQEIQDLLEICRLQFMIFQNNKLNSVENKNARKHIFALCKKLNVVPMLPSSFYHCVCEASDIISSKKLMAPLLFGCTILA